MSRFLAYCVKKFQFLTPNGPVQDMLQVFSLVKKHCNSNFLSHFLVKEITIVILLSQFQKPLFLPALTKHTFSVTKFLNHFQKILMCTSVNWLWIENKTLYFSHNIMYFSMHKQICRLRRYCNLQNSLVHTVQLSSSQSGL